MSDLGNHESDALDRLLGEWSGRQAADAESLRRLEERISSAIGEEPPAEVAAPAARDNGPQRLRARGTALSFVLGVAVGVLLMAGVLFWRPGMVPQELRHGDLQIVGAEAVPVDAVFRDEQLAERSQLLAEMESLFDRRAVWLAEAGEDVEVGVVDHAVPAESAPVVVRLVVQARRDPEVAWSRVWTVDVLARSEEVVRLAPRSGKPARLQMWSYLLPDGMIAVDTNLALEQAAPIRVSSSTLQPPGRPVEVFSGAANGYQVRVFQTAAVLGRPVI